MASTSAKIADLVAQTPRRPILTHLNADTSWLLSFPVPPSQRSNHSNGRTYFHVLLDPWLDGDIVEGYRWFMVLMHSVKATFSTIEDVQQLVRDIESCADPNYSPENDNGNIDIIVVSHYLKDHCNRGTLVTVDPETPIISVDGAVQDIKSWDHFHKIEQMIDLDLSQTQTLWQDQKPASTLPNWLRIGRLPSGERFPATHFGTLFAYDTKGNTFGSGPNQKGDKNSSAETILYTPHGIYADRVQSLEKAHEHGQKMLAVLHGLDEAWYPYPLQANLGVQNGYQVARRTQSKYWIPTHDEHLKYTGLNGYLQQKTKRAFSDIIALASHMNIGTNPQGHDGMVCRELGNGESFVLV